MKHLFLAAVAAFVSIPAAAAPKADVFTCKLKDEGQTVTVKFAISNLNNPAKASLVEVKGEKEDEFTPIVVKPKELKSGMYPEASVLNDQGGDLRVDKEKLRLFGDGDGVRYADLVLYADSGFTKGYFKGYGDGEDTYQTIFCTRKKQ